MGLVLHKLRERNVVPPRHGGTVRGAHVPGRHGARRCNANVGVVRMEHAVEDLADGRRYRVRTVPRWRHDLPTGNHAAAAHARGGEFGTT